MNTEELPLLDLFTLLRGQGLSLGVKEYQLFLYALRSGFGIRDRKALLRLCLMLWAKSLDDRQLITSCFEQVIPQSEHSVQNNKKAAQPEGISQPSEAEEIIYSGWSFDVMQVASAMQQYSEAKEITTNDYFVHTDEYFPITRRQMIQNWRYLRRPLREEYSEEIDVDATVDKIAQDGFFLEPMLAARRTNQMKLLFLVDQEGSMAPFHLLTQRLVHTALNSSRLEKTKVYYFHNYPLKYLYHDSMRLHGQKLQIVLDHLKEERYVSVLICSDAGAARGNFNMERIKATRELLYEIQRLCYRVAWLNPLPRDYWRGTTAEEVMKNVPMDEVSNQGMRNVMRHLRGEISIVHTER